MRQTVQEMAPLAPTGTQHHAADTQRLHAFFRQVNQRSGELAGDAGAIAGARLRGTLRSDG